jgi:hypothetical protein
LVSERRYDEKQIAQILHQATQMQAASSSGAGTTGLTLAEIKRLAEEVGIDSGLIAKAASEVDIESVPSGSPDRPNSILLDRLVDGHISEESWEENVVRVRHYAGRPGEVKQTSASREWLGKSDVLNMTFMATQTGKGTRLRLMANIFPSETGFAALPFAGFFVGTICGALSFKAFGAPVALAVFGTIMSGGLVTAFFGMRQWAAKRREEVKILFETITANFESAPAQQTTPAELPAETGTRLNLGG